MGEDENQLKAKRQLREDLKVYLAMLIILLLAAAITGLKMYLVQQFGPTADPNPTFKPVEQMQESSKMYNGNGFLPCKGFVPCQPGHLSPEENFERLDGS